MTEQLNSTEFKIKEIIKMRMEQKAEKTTQKINETKCWFFQNINKIAKHLNRWIRKKENLIY